MVLPDDSCIGKKRYERKTDALTTARNMRKWMHRSFDLNVYRCRYCKAWHIGTRSGRTKRQKRDKYERIRVDHLRYWDDA